MAADIPPLEHVFPQFEPDLIEKLKEHGELIHFSEGDVIMRPGQYFKYSFIILNGRVKLYREGIDGEEFFLYYLERGDACALSMICATKNEASALRAIAMTEVDALAIPLPFMDVLMKTYKGWYYFVLETYRSRFEELLQVIDQIAFHSLDEKLSFYLKRQFDALGPRLPITHQQIADDLNSSREVISRLLKKMETAGMVVVSRHEIMRGSL